MDSPTVALTVGLLTFVGGLIALVASRRKVDAETKAAQSRSAADDAETTSKISDLLQEMRSENVDLIKHNIELEKQTTDQSRQIEILTTRLASRDAQLTAATKQLDSLRELARDAPIVETLRSQLDAVNQIVLNLQNALNKGQDVLAQKEQTMQDLLRTNNDLRLKKPGKTPQ